MSIKSLLNPLIIPIIIFLLVITTNLPLDIQVPAMPIIARQLEISVSHVQLTMSLFLLGYSIFPLLYGSLSDAYGRRKIVMLALMVVIIGSIICSLTTSAQLLLLGRFIQGAGCAGTMPISRSIMRDSYQQRNMAQIASLIAIGIEISLAFSPVIGGYLVDTYGWHSNFIFILLLSVFTLVAVFFLLRETNLYINKGAVKIVTIYRNSNTVVKKPIFIRYMACTAAAFSCATAYFTISPFVIQNYLHYSAKTYGLINVIVTGAVVFGSFINAYLVKQLGIDKMILLGLLLMLFSGILLIVLALSLPVTLTAFVAPSALASFSFAFLFGNCMSGALTPFPKEAGIASSLYSMFQIMVSFIVTAVISLVPHNNSELLALVFIITSGLALWNFIRVGRNPSDSSIKTKPRSSVR